MLRVSPLSWRQAASTALASSVMAWMPTSAVLAQTPVAQALSAPYTVVDASFACQQVRCDAELWLPRGVAKPPVIIMAHGFGAQKDWGLQPFAERFVQAGFAVVRFDYRGFGKSGGQPRQVVDGKAHMKDWSSAIDAVRQRADVDGQRLGIWGTSYSGGQVLAVAADRADAVKAVSAQVPFVSGLQSSLTFPLKYQPVAAWYAVRDLLRSDDEEPLYVPIIASGQFSALICPECHEGYRKLLPAGQDTVENNRVAARVFMSLPWFRPGAQADRIQAPTLVIAAEKDGLIPVSGVRDVAAKLKHGEYLELKGANHFTPYSGPVFEQVVARQTAFFKAKLAR